MFYLFMFSAAISRVHYLLLTEPSEFYLAYQSHCLALLTIFLRNPEYLFALVHLLPKHSRVLLFNGLLLLQTKQRKNLWRQLCLNIKRCSHGRQGSVDEPQTEAVSPPDEKLNEWSSIFNRTVYYIIQTEKIRKKSWYFLLDVLDKILI